MRNNIQRAAALLLAVLLLLALCRPALAADQTLYIETAEDLQALAQQCVWERYSRGLRVVLTADIDLGGQDVSPIPIFAGVLDGQGHSITGLHLSETGSQQGLFRYLAEGAQVRNLSISATVTPQGSMSSVGILAGENAGLIENCTVSGTVTGEAYVGGLVGKNTETGSILACANLASVRGTDSAGGIAGRNEGRISDCTNQGSINCHNDESFRNVGGIAGHSTGRIKNSQNDGAVGHQHNGYSVGGIAGMQAGILTDCRNNGGIQGRKDVGGIAGQLEPYRNTVYGRSMLEQLEEELGIMTDLMRVLGDDLDDAMSDGSQDIKDLLDLVDAAGNTVSDAAHSTADTIEEALDLLEVQSDRLSDSFDEILDELERLTDEAGQDLDDAEAALEDLSDALSDGLGDADDAARDTIETLEDHIADMEAALGRAETALGRAKTAANNCGALIQSAVVILSDPSTSDAEKMAALADAYQQAGDTNILSHLNTAISAVNSAVGQLPSLVSSLGDGYMDISDALGDMADDLDDAIDDLSDAISSLRENITRFSDRSTAALREVNDSISQMGDILHSSMDETGDQLDASSDELEQQTQAIHDRVDSMADGFSDFGDDLHHTVDGILDQLDVIVDVFTNAETPEYTLEDISDSNPAVIPPGSILRCENNAAVEGDINAGGIVGLAGFALLEDPEEEWELPDELLVDTTELLWAVIDSCTNYGTVQAKNDCAGGILGRGRVGAVLRCVNSGDVESEDGNYCGGIAGRSAGLLSNSHAQCLLRGNDYVGGIVGEGNDVQDCYAMAEVVAEGECLGAIAGDVIEDSEQSGNRFIMEGLGGIDGIHYTDRAEPLPYEEFISLPGLPAAFLQFGVQFVADGQVVETVSLAYGESFDPARIPDCPQKDGCNGRWESFDAQQVHRMLRVNAEYLSWSSTIATDEAVPRLLAEGQFSDRAQLLLTDLAADETPLPKGYSLLGNYQYEIRDGGTQPEAATLRLRVDSQRAAVAVLTDGQMTILPSQQDGSYLVFSGGGSGQFFLLEQDRNMVLLAAVALGVIALLSIPPLVKRRRKGSPPSAPTQTPEPQEEHV